MIGLLSKAYPDWLRANPVEARALPSEGPSALVSQAEFSLHQPNLFTRDGPIV